MSVLITPEIGRVYLAQQAFSSLLITLISAPGSIPAFCISWPKSWSFIDHYSFEVLFSLPYSLCSFDHICFLSSWFLWIFCSSAWFLSCPHCDKFIKKKKMNLFSPISIGHKTRKDTQCLRSVFYLESVSRLRKYWASQLALECDLWSHRQWHSILSLTTALNHSFVFFWVFVYLFVLICLHFNDSQFLLSVANHTTAWIFMKLSYPFRLEYWHFQIFSHKAEQQVLFPS